MPDNNSPDYDQFPLVWWTASCIVMQKKTALYEYVLLVVKSRTSVTSLFVYSTEARRKMTYCSALFGYFNNVDSDPTNSKNSYRIVCMELLQSFET